MSPLMPYPEQSKQTGIKQARNFLILMVGGCYVGVLLVCLFINVCMLIHLCRGSAVIGGRKARPDVTGSGCGRNQ